ncbi:hypothetical protein INR49_007917 [Caranx melampygus]|nr:hypothetical protein INR49_007917 [Caranx melampygus]
MLSCVLCVLAAGGVRSTPAGFATTYWSSWSRCVVVAALMVAPDWLIGLGFTRETPDSGTAKVLSNQEVELTNGVDTKPSVG